MNLKLKCSFFRFSLSHNSFYAIVVFVDAITNVTIMISNLTNNFCFMTRVLQGFPNSGKGAGERDSNFPQWRGVGRVGDWKLCWGKIFLLGGENLRIDLEKSNFCHSKNIIL